MAAIIYQDTTFIQSDHMCIVYQELCPHQSVGEEGKPTGNAFWYPPSTASSLQGPISVLNIILKCIQWLSAMQNPTPWIFHVLMTTTFELGDNYQLTVHLFWCRTKARGWIWAVPLVFRMMSSCSSASQAVGSSGVIPLTLEQNKRRFVHFIIVPRTVREMSICHQQHHPLFFFSHSRETYLWDALAQFNGREICAY